MGPRINLNANGSVKVVNFPKDEKLTPLDANIRVKEPQNKPNGRPFVIMIGKSGYVIKEAALLN